MNTAELVTTASTDLDRSRTAQALAGAWLLELNSENTRAAYRRDLEGFQRFLQEIATDQGVEAPDLLQASRQIVALYKEQLRARGMTPATVARKLSALSSFYGYAVIEGAIAASPLAHLKRPTVSENSQTLGPDREELGRLLEAAREVSPNAYALLCLLGLVGLRVSEVTAAEVSDLNYEQGKVRKHRTLTVTRKGGDRQTLALPELAVQALEQAIGERTEGPLLLRASGLPLDRYDCSRLVARVAKRAGVEKRLSPHSMRHGFVTLSLEAGQPLHAVADAAGHSDPRTTRRYDRARQNLDRSPTYALAAYLEESLSS